jgi:hypothetical protein
MSWELRHNTAKWTEPKWSVLVALTNDACQPTIEVHDAAKDIRLRLGIMPREQHSEHTATGLPAGDAYVRQKDLIALFPESTPWRFGYQIDVRMLDDPPNGSLAIEFWLSIQTSLLDTYPQLGLRLQGEPFQSMLDHCWVSSSSNIGLLIHPLDEQDCHIQSVSDGLQMKVFGRFMEKGVIRRMRFRMLLNPKNEPASFWQDRFEEFSGSPLPLTT